MSPQKRIDRLREFAATLPDRFMADEITWMCDRSQSRFQSDDPDKRLKDLARDLQQIKWDVDDALDEIEELAKAS